MHFTCFVQAPEASAREAEVTTNKRRLIELDGRRAGPVDRGESTDLLKVRPACRCLSRIRPLIFIRMWPSTLKIRSCQMHKVRNSVLSHWLVGQSSQENERRSRGLYVIGYLAIPCLPKSYGRWESCMDFTFLYRDT